VDTFIKLLRWLGKNWPLLIALAIAVVIVLFNAWAMGHVRLWGA